jgi:hypothetical protein
MTSKRLNSAHVAASATARAPNVPYEAVSSFRVWRSCQEFPHLSERLPYHQNCANETRGRKPFGVEEIRLCANGRLLRVPRKPRNVRRNSCQSKDKNTRYIIYLYRGGEGWIRTMNLADRSHLKNRTNSASCAPESLTERRYWRGFLSQDERDRSRPGRTPRPSHGDRLWECCSRTLSGAMLTLCVSGRHPLERSWPHILRRRGKRLIVGRGALLDIARFRGVGVDAGRR